ncbi:MAG: ABC transporter permease [bacterium]|nr:ABC transporter permease [bacterium]
MKRRSAGQMGLPLPWILASRYLWGGRRDAYVVFLSVLAIVGIAMGVAALILVLGGLSGLQDFLRSDVLSRTLHVEVELPPDADAAALCRSLGEIGGVVEAQPILRGRGWLLFGGTAVHVQAVGFEGLLPRSFPLARGSATPEGDNGVYVGDALARRWALEVGDLVDVVSPRPTLTPFGPQPRSHRLRLAGIFRTGRTEDDDQRIAVPLQVARRLFGAHESRIEIKTANLEAALEIADEVTLAVPEGSRVRTWRELNRALFFALKLEKVVMFAALLLIVTVAAVALTTVLALLISSKRGDIGMLLAMGATEGQMQLAFLLHGSLLGAIGLLIGGSFGIGGAHLLDRFRLITPPGDIYFLDHIPFLVELGDLAAVLVATVALIGASTLYAARRAAALGPVEALRI